MEFNEIDVPDGIIQQIDPAGQFADITVDVRNGSVPGFMKFSSKEVLVHNWSS